MNKVSTFKGESVGVGYRSCRITASGSDGRTFQWKLIESGLYSLGDTPVTLNEITTLLASEYRTVSVQDLDELDGGCPYCGRLLG